MNEFYTYIWTMDAVVHHTAGQVPPVLLVGPEVRPPSGGAEGVRAPSRRIAPPKAPHPSIRVDNQRQRGALRLPAPHGEPLPGGTERAGSLPVPLEAPGRGGPGYNPHSLFLTQHIAQELLEEGLYINRHPAASAAYQSAARAQMTFLGPEGSLDLAV